MEIYVCVSLQKKKPDDTNFKHHRFRCFETFPRSFEAIQISVADWSFHVRIIFHISTNGAVKREGRLGPCANRPRLKIPARGGKIRLQSSNNKTHRIYAFCHVVYVIHPSQVFHLAENKTANPKAPSPLSGPGPFINSAFN
jgi:hypothetical protein